MMGKFITPFLIKPLGLAFAGRGLNPFLIQLTKETSKSIHWQMAYNLKDVSTISATNFSPVDL